MTPQPTVTDDGTASPEYTPPPIVAPAVEAGPFYDESTEPGVPRTRRTGPFIATKEYRRFTEFADAVRRETFIGLCYGSAGVGKTLSARRYARWDKVEELLLGWGRREESDAAVYATLARSRTAFYTPTTTCTPKQLEQDLDQLLGRIDICVAQHRRVQTKLPIPLSVSHRGTPQVVDLLIVDEAERLTQQSLEHLRDRFDRRATGLILIGMPGIDRSLSRHPQLYSRVGFAHQYRTLGDDELAFVLTRHWAKLGLTLDLSDFTDAGIDTLELDPATGALTHDTRLPLVLVSTDGAEVWGIFATARHGDYIARIDPATGTVSGATSSPFTPTFTPDTIAVNSGNAWIINTNLQTLTKVTAAHR